LLPKGRKKAISLRNKRKESFSFAFRSLNRTFAGVKLEIRRHIASWLLLAVFLPMLVLSSLHVHNEGAEAAAVECADCVHHSCHGHLAQTASWSHDCVICQFLTLTFIAAATVVVSFIFNVSRIINAPLSYAVYDTNWGNIVTRGPPTV